MAAAPPAFALSPAHVAPDQLIDLGTATGAKLYNRQHDLSVTPSTIQMSMGSSRFSNF